MESMVKNNVLIVTEQHYSCNSILCHIYFQEWIFLYKKTNEWVLIVEKGAVRGIWGGKGNEMKGKGRWVLWDY